MIESYAYAYDALGRRVATTTANGTERHVYDDNWQVIADLDANGNVLRSYVWDAGIDRLLAVKIGSRTYTAHTDVQGTVWAFSDEQGNAAAVFGYDAWGNVVSCTYAPGAEVLAGVRYGFQGREHSRLTGFIHFRMRWYDPVTGRWLSKDPIGLSGGLNLYCFCRDCPSVMIDPIGQMSREEFCAWMGGFAEGFIDAICEGELTKGLAATADGFLPFCDPFEGVYSDECGNYDSAYDVSKISGAISFECFTCKIGFKTVRFMHEGREIPFGKNLRIAPNGNRTGNALGELPHYHRRVRDINGATRPGQGIGRHRPWDTKKTDTSFGDRF